MGTLSSSKNQSLDLHQDSHNAAPLVPKSESKVTRSVNIINSEHGTPGGSVRGSLQKVKPGHDDNNKDETRSNASVISGTPNFGANTRGNATVDKSIISSPSSTAGLANTLLTKNKSSPQQLNNSSIPQTQTHSLPILGENGAGLNNDNVRSTADTVSHALKDVDMQKLVVDTDGHAGNNGVYTYVCVYV